MHKKAQLSIEFIFILAMIIIFLTPIIYYAYHTSSNIITRTQSEEAILSLIQEANTVHALGPGTKKYLYVTLPGGVESFTIKDRQLFLKTGLSGRYNYRSEANLTGKLPQTRGTHYMWVESLESGKVLINYTQ